MLAAAAFDILIPTWNNLSFLKCCIESIRENSRLDHRILVFVNEGNDGTEDWLRDKAIEYLSAPDNVGICRAINRLLEITKAENVLYLNDDMYVLPGWDNNLIGAIPEERLWMLSATMIEPKDTGNPCVLVFDAGSNPQTLQKKRLIQHMEKHERPDWSGSTWPPLLMSRKSWIEAGGLSEEFSPGMYSDPDLAMKLWQMGCRSFRGVGDSLVYHFQAKSTGRVKKNKGRKQFMKKWGITASAFYHYYLHMGQSYSGILSKPGNPLALAVNRCRVRLTNWLR